MVLLLGALGVSVVRDIFFFFTCVDHELAARNANLGPHYVFGILIVACNSRFALYTSEATVGDEEVLGLFLGEGYEVVEVPLDGLNAY